VGGLQHAHTHFKLRSALSLTCGCACADVQRFVSRTSPLKGALLLPQDIANAFVFLASDMGRCVNAHTLVVDLGVAAGVTGKLSADAQMPRGAVTSVSCTLGVGWQNSSRESQGVDSPKHSATLPQRQLQSG